MVRIWFNLVKEALGASHSFAVLRTRLSRRILRTLHAHCGRVGSPQVEGVYIYCQVSHIATQVIYLCTYIQHPCVPLASNLLTSRQAKTRRSNLSSLSQLPGVSAYSESNLHLSSSRRVPATFLLNLPRKGALAPDT